MNHILENINEIPVKTWKWLGVNGITLEEEVPSMRPYNKAPLISKEPVGISIYKEEKEQNFLSKELSADIRNEKLQHFIEENHNSNYVVHAKEGVITKEPIVLQYHLDDTDSVLVDRTVIVAEKNSNITVIIQYESNNTAKTFHSGLTKVYAKEGAVVNLIKVQALSDSSTHIDCIGGGVEKDGDVRIITAEIGSKSSVSSLNIKLLGESSNLSFDSIFIGDQERILDMDYYAMHKGKSTTSNIEARGILLGRAKKTLRMTLDFISGSSGSKGKEEEYTALLSPQVKNVTAPLLLCGEDDVEGTHAASTGKLDESKLFYLMTRGFSEDEAKKLMIEAAIMPIIEKIQLESLRESIKSLVRERITNV